MSLPDPVSQYADREELTDDDWDDFRDAIRDQYRFYITNPAHTERVGYSLWYVESPGEEFPVLQNTSGMSLFASRSRDVGAGLTPTREFVDLVGLGIHEALCFMGFDPDQFDRTANMVYDEKPRHHELWAAGEIVNHVFHDGVRETRVRELDPLRIAADKYTEFNIPGVDDFTPTSEDGEHA